MAFANYCFICGSFRDGLEEICPNCESPYVIYNGKIPHIEVYSANSKLGREVEKTATLYTCSLCNEVINSDGTCRCSENIELNYLKMKEKREQKEADIIRECDRRSQDLRVTNYYENRAAILSGEYLEKCESCKSVIILGLCKCNRM